MFTKSLGVFHCVYCCWAGLEVAGTRALASTPRVIVLVGVGGCNSAPHPCVFFFLVLFVYKWGPSSLINIL